MKYKFILFLPGYLKAQFRSLLNLVERGYCVLAVTALGFRLTKMVIYVLVLFDGGMSVQKLARPCFVCGFWGFGSLGLLSLHQLCRVLGFGRL